MNVFRLNAVRGLTMMLGIIASAWFAQSAEASCGDWLSSHAAEHRQTDSSEAPVPGKPCHGPMCQGDVPLSPPAPAPQFRPVSQDWACLLETQGPTLLVGTSASVEATANARSGLGCDIFRPPRLA